MTQDLREKREKIRGIIEMACDRHNSGESSYGAAIWALSALAAESVRITCYDDVGGITAIPNLVWKAYSLQEQKP